MGTQTLQARQINSTTGALTDYGTVTAKATPPANVLVVGNNSTGLFIMNANGSGFKQLTTGGVDTEPDLSPDHTKIVFFSTRYADSTAVFLMNVDGTNIHRISKTMFEQAAGPEWSPNGATIIYSGEPFGYEGCFVLECGGLQQVWLSDTLGNAIQGFGNGGGDYLINATWTASGAQYLFSFNGTDLGGLDLFLSCPAALGGPLSGCETTTSWTPLTQGWNVQAAAASPDGSHIALLGIAAAGTGYPGAGTGYPGPGSYLYIMNADGTGITPLTSATGFGGFVSYSPDGTLIAVDHGFINTDGTGYTVVAGCPCRFAWK